MIGKKILFIFMLLSLSASSFAQHNDHKQTGDQATDASADQHGGKDMSMGKGDKKGHGDMSMKMDDEKGRGGMSMNVSHTRHHFAMDNGIGESYKGQQSSLAASDIDVARAKSLYQGNCASCHGDLGLGDGVEGAGLDPAPTNIARFAKMKMAKDDYLLWALSEGGEPVGSEMPAFKEVLSIDEMWQIVGYLRQL